MYSQSSTNLNDIRLGDYIDLLTDYHANGSYEILKKHVELLDEPDYAIMIRTKNFENEKFHTDLKYISESAYNFLKKSKVQPGDIIMNKIANAGSVYRMPDLGRPVSLAMNLFLIRVDDARIDRRYAYYLLKKNEAYIKTFANGTATKTITKDAVKNLVFTLPEIGTQRKVASLLASIEELILANDKRVRLLHNLGLKIYEKNFSNEEGVTGILESPYWQIVKSNVSKYTGKKTYLATADIDGLNIVGSGIEYTYSDRPSRAQKQPIRNSIWLARMKDTYKVAFFNERNETQASSILLSSGFVGFQATENNYFPYMFFTFSSADFEKQKNRFSTGATQVSITNDGLRNIKFPTAKKDTVTEFGLRTEPIINDILTIQRQSMILRQERDLLLNGLIPDKGNGNDSK